VFELTVGTFLIAFNNQIVKRGLSQLKLAMDGKCKWRMFALRVIMLKKLLHIFVGVSLLKLLSCIVNITGFGLKESKDACEAAREKAEG